MKMAILPPELFIFPIWVTLIKKAPIFPRNIYYFSRNQIITPKSYTIEILRSVQNITVLIWSAVLRLPIKSPYANGGLFL